MSKMSPGALRRFEASGKDTVGAYLARKARIIVIRSSVLGTIFAAIAVFPTLNLNKEYGFLFAFGVCLGTAAICFLFSLIYAIFVELGGEPEDGEYFSSLTTEERAEAVGFHDYEE